MIKASEEREADPASLGVLTEDDQRGFGLTLLGERLRTGVPASMRAWAMLVESLGGVRAFEPIIETVQILTGCRHAMAGHGRVLIVERLIPDDPADALPVLLSDLNMLVFTGGQERTNTEYGHLLAAAG